MRRISSYGSWSGSTTSRSGLRIAQMQPARTPAATCRVVALLCGQSARFLERQLRAVPVRALAMPHQQDAELVAATDQLVLDDALSFRRAPVVAGELVQ